MKQSQTEERRRRLARDVVTYIRDHDMPDISDADVVSALTVILGIIISRQSNPGEWEKMTFEELKRARAEREHLDHAYVN